MRRRDELLYIAFADEPETLLRSSMSYMWVFLVFWLGAFANKKQLRTVRSLGLVTDVDMAQQMSYYVRCCTSKLTHKTGFALTRVNEQTPRLADGIRTEVRSLASVVNCSQVRSRPGLTLNCNAFLHLGM